MKKAVSRAFAALMMILVTFTLTGSLWAAPLQTISSGGDFAVASVVEVPGTYPPVIHVYGGSSREGFSYTTFGVLTSTDNFATPPTWQPLTGVVGYAGTLVNSAIVTCPAGKACGGYKAFYVTSNLSGVTLYRCTGLSGLKDLSGCVSWSISGMTSLSESGIGLDQSGDKLLLGGHQVGDTYQQIYSVDIASGTATKLNACGNVSKSTGLNGSAVNGFLFVTYNFAHYRFPWDGMTCSGPRVKAGTALGWDDALDSPTDNDLYGAVGALTGSYYTSSDDWSTFLISKKDASCSDGFISGAEMCDGSNLNGQDCTTIGMGFTGGTLKCNGSCGWDTSACISPAVCGNGVKEGAEVCDGSDFGGASCSSIMGAGWTGSLVCTGCITIDSSGCVPPAPVCGDLACNGGETCSSCPTDCGVCPPVCGNNIKEGSETCDGSDLAGQNCTTIPGGYSGGTLQCQPGCSAFDTSLCTSPATCGDLTCNGGETCSSCPGDCGVCPPICGNGVKEGAEVCDNLDFGGKTCASEKGSGWTGTLACTGSCSTIDSSGCTPPAPVCGDMSCNGTETCGSCPTDCGSCCGNGVIDPGEICDGMAMGGASCSSILGPGYTGMMSCKMDCTGFITASCIAPPTCGNGKLDDGELCDGTLFAPGKTCSSEKGEGWTGSLVCSSCMIDSSACVPPPWGIKVKAGSCSVDNSGGELNPVLSVNGLCDFELLPKDSATKSYFTLASTLAKAVPFTVAGSPDGITKAIIPQGVDGEQVATNGNKMYLQWGDGVIMGTEGTGYKWTWTGNTVKVTCTDPTIVLGYTDPPGSAPYPFDIGAGQGKLVADWSVEIDTVTKAITKAPYKEGGGGDGGTDGGTDAGPDSGITDAGDGGTDAGDDGGAGSKGGGVIVSGGGGFGACSSATRGEGSGYPLLLILAGVAFFFKRRNKRA